MTDKLAESGVLAAIQIGRCQTIQAAENGGKAWESAIFKTSVDEPILARVNGLCGDEQADRVHHGGIDKAILAYCAEHYPLWNREYPQISFVHGGFGENLTISGLDESQACLGDVYAAGDCLLEVSQPRQPCWKLSRRWNLEQLAATVQRNGRSGWYLRVKREGMLAAGMTMYLQSRPYPEVSVARANAIFYQKPRQASDLRRLADCPALADAWRDQLKKILA